jgi:hypothetical protein
LDSLNAKYDRHLVSDFSFGGIIIPDELQSRRCLCREANCLVIDDIASQLEAVNNSNEITVDFKFNVSQYQSISRYDKAFHNLRNILRKTPKHFSFEAT